METLGHETLAKQGQGVCPNRSTHTVSFDQYPAFVISYLLMNLVGKIFGP